MAKKYERAYLIEPSRGQGEHPNIRADRKIGNFLDMARKRTEEETKRRLAGGRRVIEPTRLQSYKSPLILIVSHQPFEWLKSGEKTVEFREYNAYYADRLLGCGNSFYQTVIFQNGYIKPNRPFPPRIEFKIEGFYLYDGCDEIPAFQSDGALTTEQNLPDDFVPNQITIHLGERVR